MNIIIIVVFINFESEIGWERVRFGGGQRSNFLVLNKKKITLIIILYILKNESNNFTFF